jgi:hypothetical protein
VRKTAPTLIRHAGLLSAAPSGLVARSLDDLTRTSNCTQL